MGRENSLYQEISEWNLPACALIKLQINFFWVLSINSWWVTGLAELCLGRGEGSEPFFTMSHYFSIIFRPLRTHTHIYAHPVHCCIGIGVWDTHCEIAQSSCRKWPRCGTSLRLLLTHCEIALTAQGAVAGGPAGQFIETRTKPQFLLNYLWHC